MTNLLTINAQYRTILGTNHNNKLRKKNKIPAILYSKNKKNIYIKIKYNEFYNLIRNKNKIYKIKWKILIKFIKIFPCYIKEIQKHPVKNKILHIDFIF